MLDEIKNRIPKLEDFEGENLSKNYRKMVKVKSKINHPWCEQLIIGVDNLHPNKFLTLNPYTGEMAGWPFCEYVHKLEQEQAEPEWTKITGHKKAYRTKPGKLS